MKNLVLAGKCRASKLYNAVFLLLASLAIPGMAMAQTTDFDPAPVIAKIATYVGYGIAMVAAWILGKWTLKALGVIGGK